MDLRVHLSPGAGIMKGDPPIDGMYKFDLTALVLFQEKVDNINIFNVKFGNEFWDKPRQSSGRIPDKK